MGKQHPPLSPEERLEMAREYAAPILARIAIQVHLDEERKRIAGQMRRQNDDDPKAA